MALAEMPTCKPTTLDRPISTNLPELTHTWIWATSSNIRIRIIKTKNSALKSDNAPYYEYIITITIYSTVVTTIHVVIPLKIDTHHSLAPFSRVAIPLKKQSVAKAGSLV